MMFTSLALFPGLYYLFSPPTLPLSPTSYSRQKIEGTETISPQHKLVSIPVSPAAQDLFDRLQDKDQGELTVFHMMVGSPDIQIERPYTPVNDPNDGKLDMVVKRVRGGEVGR